LQWLKDNPFVPPDEPDDPGEIARRDARRERMRRRVPVTVWYVARPDRMSKTGWDRRAGPFDTEAEAIAHAGQERERAAGRWRVEVVAEEVWRSP
jgi:hypothetical protein